MDGDGVDGRADGDEPGHGAASDVCVHGLGYVGLPTAAMFAAEGYDVRGVDVDESKVDRLRSGALDVEPDLTAFVRDALAGSLDVSTEPTPAAFHVVCVPTPLADDAEPRADLSMVDNAAETVTRLLRPGDAVVLESTVPPGTTAGRVATALEASGLVAGREFHLAHAPETVTPGDALSELRANDRIVGGVTPESTARAASLYEGFTEGTVRRTDSATTAEFVKLAQNTYRDVNIALANEFARAAAGYGIDAREAIELANTHPRVDVHSPGPGVGGHCVPVDPWFLVSGADGMGLVRHARSVNDAMPAYVAALVEATLSGLDGARVAVCGVAYKAGVADARNSSGRRVAEALDVAGAASTALHDPFVEAADVTADVDAALSGADAVVFTTDHAAYAEVDPERAAATMAGAGAVDAVDVLDRPAWRTAGFDLRVV